MLPSGLLPKPSWSGGGQGWSGAALFLSEESFQFGKKDKLPTVLAEKGVFALLP